MRDTGGNYDAAHRFLYFTACNMADAIRVAPLHHELLIAVNEINTTKEGDLERLVESNAVLLDSGVFNLAMRHAVKRGVTLGEALAAPIETIQGFAALRSRYVELMRRFGAGSWGYIEIDIGGRDQKRITRRELEGEGLRPIPVWHPLSDGAEYLDELLEGYDRICVGNLVTASSYIRKRILATLWEKKRLHPDVWIHALGVTPSPLLNAYPTDSCDSSAWLTPIKFPREGVIERSCNKAVGAVFQGMTQARRDSVGITNLRRLSALQYDVNAANWRHLMRGLQA